MDDYLKTRVKTDFEEAKHKAFLNDLWRSIFKQNNQLYRLDEVKYFFSPYAMSYVGIKSIPIDHIVGSEGRYEDFDKDFMPRQDKTRYRWENVDMAYLSAVNLPPISVYKLGDYYFVRDGNHRVSVAQKLGMEFIDAEVIELFTKVKVKPSMLTEKGLLLTESYRYFLEKTHLDEKISGADIELTHPWGYYRMVEHINYYRYILGEREKREIPWEEVVVRWYKETYTSVTRLIRKSGVLKRFPGRTEGDLYIWIMDHWHFLKEKSGDVKLKDAVRDFSHRFGMRPILRWFKSLGDSLFGWLGRGRK